ncbi:uncharacterized protein LOC120330981 [Styela clava]|uniref:uncharacterized protein LOC120330981 n=1 Tax=Styela clava TaxID=7725 RepID=UPI00193ACB82|nr:uncharacterized protein LOC120330981 [Styela clava]
MDDDNLLVPDQESPSFEEMLKTHSQEIMKIFLPLGITQLVLGVVILIGGVIIAASWPDYGADSSAEGIWCGILIVVCGAMSITARYHLYSGVVISCLVLNITSAVLNAIGVVIAAISFFGAAGHHWYGGGKFVIYTALNGGLTACLVISIYLSISFGKILSQKKEVCCFGSSPYNYGGYAMVYVPPGTEMQHTQVGGAFMAVPPGQRQTPTQP